MRKLTATLCLTFAILLGSAGMSASADYQKGLTAYKSGNYATAKSVWEPLAEEGDPRAQFYLGQMHELGHGVQQDFDTAARWYIASAALGNAHAQHNLGLLYMIGEGVMQNYPRAVELFIQSAEHGHEVSQQTLGDMYFYGHGVQRDPKIAMKWYRRLKKQSNKGITAEYVMGKINAINNSN